MPINARLGMVAITPPRHVPQSKSLEWAIREAVALKLEVVNGGGDPPFDLPYWGDLRARAADKGVEIEPWVRSPFDLVGPGGARGRSLMVKNIRASRELGGPMLRTGYGDQKIRRTRYGTRDLPGHIAFLKANLSVASKIAESEGVILAIENHTDFTGREWAGVLEDVDSPHIRAAFDTANGMTIFGNPLEDAEAVGKWTLTTHMKDLRVVEIPRGRFSTVPFTLVGCPLGDGHVGIRPILSRLLKDSPLRTRLPLIVEPSWPAVGAGESLSDVRRKMLRASLRNLKRMLKELEATHVAS